MVPGLVKEVFAKRWYEIIDYKPKILQIGYSPKVCSAVGPEASCSDGITGSRCVWV